MKKKTLLIFTLIAVCLACCTLVLKPQRVSVHIWQYTEKGKISSYDKTLDLNCFVNGMTVEKLKL